MLEFYTVFLQSMCMLTFNKVVGWFINHVKEKNTFDIKTGDKISVFYLLALSLKASFKLHLILKVRLGF